MLVFECTSVVFWSGTCRWKRKIFDSFRYHHTLALNALCAWPMDYTLFQFPICTDRKLIDQCARGLSILGLPNFYFQDQLQLVESKTLAVINGSKFRDIEGQIPGASR
jgi:hypothetical protein